MHYPFCDEGVRRIINTAISIIAILVLLYIRNEAVRFGFSGIFSIVPLLMIILIVLALIRSWIRG